uniref:Uncharacterized protein n=1 Tax=Anguilla anguilla TaxID=7936 RepID=A0A0E9V0K6_ANGAN
MANFQLSNTWVRFGVTSSVRLLYVNFGVPLQYLLSPFLLSKNREPPDTAGPGISSSSLPSSLLI